MYTEDEFAAWKIAKNISMEKHKIGSWSRFYTLIVVINMSQIYNNLFI